MDDYLRTHAPARVLAAAAAAAADRAAAGLAKSLYFPTPNDDMMTWDNLLGTSKAVSKNGKHPPAPFVTTCTLLPPSPSPSIAAT